MFARGHRFNKAYSFFFFMHIYYPNEFPPHMPNGIFHFLCAQAYSSNVKVENAIKTTKYKNGN